MIAEGKELSRNWQSATMTLRVRGGSAENFADFTGADGTGFRILVRQSQQRPDDFSVILMAILPQPIVPNKPEFRLLRYDGGGHAHRNTIEGNRIPYKPHIHRSTERYQASTSQYKPAPARRVRRGNPTLSRFGGGLGLFLS